VPGCVCSYEGQLEGGGCTPPCTWAAARGGTRPRPGRLLRTAAVVPAPPEAHEGRWQAGTSPQAGPGAATPPTDAFVACSWVAGDTAAAGGGEPTARSQAHCLSARGRSRALAGRERHPSPT
jgi:hypothetical protein